MGQLAEWELVSLLGFSSWCAPNKWGCTCLIRKHSSYHCWVLEEMQKLPSHHLVCLCVGNNTWWYAFYPEYWEVEGFSIWHSYWASLVAQMVKNFPVVQETQVQSLGQEDPLEKGMATYSSILTWLLQWMEEPGRLQFMRSQRAGNTWVTEHFHLRGEVVLMACHWHRMEK